MKNKIILTVLLGLAFISCKKGETPQFEDPPKVAMASAIVDECYIYVKGKDTIQANLTFEGEKVVGELAYKFFEKDKSSGPFVGIKDGDTLVGEYTFESEGMQSVREVVFLKTRNNLTEGYADMKEREGKMVFKDKRLLRFDSKTELLLTPCK